jgi:hypothetical protein
MVPAVGAALKVQPGGHCAAVEPPTVKSHATPPTEPVHVGT